MIAKIAVAERPVGVSCAVERMSQPAGRARPGEVWLVGAGPGASDLLTLRAVDALHRADLILHDKVAGPIARRHARRDAELVCVGKRKGTAPVPQARINQLIVEAAWAGRRVVRLKAGDPFVFGRGGEEALACGAAGVDCHVVPGVSAGTAAPAAAGIPLTHRGLASSVTFITGHDERGGLPALDWEALARLRGTLVAFMALSRLDELSVQLLAGGRDARTPVAIIAAATLARQTVLRSTLGECTLAARQASLPMPALVVIGEVAAFELGVTIALEELRRHG